MRALLFMVLAGMGLVRADPPDIHALSPDQEWAVDAPWIQGKGYAWELRNVKTGKVFFYQDQIGENDGLPRLLPVSWSPDGRYVAITDYYGRAMAEIEVIYVGGPEPKGVDLHLEPSRTPLELTLMHPAELRNYDGYNRLLTTAGPWLNRAELEVDIEARIFLKDKTSGVSSVLHTEWTKTVRFGGGTSRVIKTECTDYSFEAPEK